MESYLDFLARLVWDDPVSGERRELPLSEGQTATIGRLDSNDICIREQHVSRQHATISFRDGVFVINDMGSANGVFVNNHRVTEPYPLLSGDEIRLYVPTLYFVSYDDNEPILSTQTPMFTLPGGDLRRAELLVTTADHQAEVVPLDRAEMRVGRDTSKAEWEICLRDPSVSRPHARFLFQEDAWVLYDLGSANGTYVNGTPVSEKGRALRDGDIVQFGTTTATFRQSERT
jgi:pSer/pThr/pTyr-binding forkhead associated (FHA) protein